MKIVVAKALLECMVNGTQSVDRGQQRDSKVLQSPPDGQRGHALAQRGEGSKMHDDGRDALLAQALRQACEDRVSHDVRRLALIPEHRSDRAAMNQGSG
jgi:hypothetical protein